MKCWPLRIKVSVNVWLLMFALLQLFSLSDGYGQFYGKKRVIHFKKVNNLVVIPLMVNGKGPFNFILDTGVDPLIITDTSIVNSVKAKKTATVKISGLGSEKEIYAFFSTENRVEAGGAVIDSIPTFILKDNVLDLSNYMGLNIHGLIGFYFFNSFLVKINYTSNRLTFGVAHPKKTPKGVKIALDFLEKKPYINTQIQTQSLGEIEAKLMVDCGASHALYLERYKNNPFPVPKPHISGHLGLSLTGEINGEIARIAALKIGPYQFKNIITSFPNYYALNKTLAEERVGNLGAEILRRFTVTFNYQGKAMYLKKNKAYAAPFERDLSGLELYAAGEKYQRIFIASVAPGSAAEQSEFKVNDEIVLLNFKSINNLEEIRAILKSEHEKALILTILRNGDLLNKIIYLKKII